MAAQNRHQQIQLKEKLIHSSTQPMLSVFAEKWNLKLCHASKVMPLMRKLLLKKNKCQTVFLSIAKVLLK